MRAILHPVVSSLLVATSYLPLLAAYPPARAKKRIAKLGGEQSRTSLQDATKGQIATPHAKVEARLPFEVLLDALMLYAFYAS